MNPTQDMSAQQHSPLPTVLPIVPVSYLPIRIRLYDTG